MGLLSVSQLKDPICFAGTTGKSAPPICRLHRLTAPKFSKKIHEFSKKILKFAFPGSAHPKLLLLDLVLNILTSKWVNGVSDDDRRT